jgi:hypothetical protein
MGVGEKCLTSEKCGVSKVLRERDEQDKVMQFLMGVSDQFNITKSQILSYTPLPSLNSVYNTILRDEK